MIGSLGVQQQGGKGHSGIRAPHLKSSLSSCLWQGGFLVIAGGGGQLPSAHPPSALQECRAQELEAGVGCLSHLPPPPIRVLSCPVKPWPWGVFHVFWAWKGNGVDTSWELGGGVPLWKPEDIATVALGQERRRRGAKFSGSLVPAEALMISHPALPLCPVTRIQGSAHLGPQFKFWDSSGSLDRRVTRTLAGGPECKRLWRVAAQ